MMFTRQHAASTVPVCSNILSDVKDLQMPKSGHGMDGRLAFLVVKRHGSPFSNGVTCWLKKTASKIGMNSGCFLIYYLYVPLSLDGYKNLLHFAEYNVYIKNKA
jgi:hypothetical protein